MWLLMLLAIELVPVLAFNGNFINPPPSTSTNPSLSYVNGSIVSVTWESDLEWVALVMFPTGNGDLQYLSPDSSNLSNAGVFPWLVGNTTTYTDGLLAIFNPGDSTALFESADFSIVSPSSSVSATSTATSISATSSTSSTSTATQSAIVTQSATQSSGLSAGTAAGIGVGASLGLVLLIAIGIFIGWRLHKKRYSRVNSRDNNTFGVEVGGSVRPMEMTS